MHLHLPLHKVTNEDRSNVQEDRTFRSGVSKLTAQQVAEKEMWGKSLNGYIGGGNLDENPKLLKYTLQKYQ